MMGDSEGLSLDGHHFQSCISLNGSLRLRIRGSEFPWGKYYCLTWRDTGGGGDALLGGHHQKEIGGPVS